MPDDGEQRSRWIRARQRDPNSGMVGFDAALSPTLADVGVDRCRITITGRWHSQSDGRSLFENTLYLAEVDWFNRPQRPRSVRSTSWKVSMSKLRNGSTINACEIVAKRINTSEGIVQIDLTLNPTRTLAHLLVRAEGSVEQIADTPENLQARLRTLPVVEFFARAEGATLRSLDGSDNVLPPARQVRERLGGEFWSSFVAIFVGQVRQLCLDVVSEYPSVQTEGAVDRVSLPNGVVSFDWGEVKVPQIECYFERFHSEAVTAVRRGGWAVLAADHSSEMRTYADRATFGRDNDRFSVGLALDETHKLAIYAKRSDRLRFEVRRTGKGDYSDLPSATSPTARMVEIIQSEREHLLDAVVWPNVGELLSGPDRPQLHDLDQLIEQVRWAAEGDTDVFAMLLKALLIEGSLSGEIAPAGAIRRLLQRNVVARVRIRRRDMKNRVWRYALTAPFRDIHHLLVDPLR